MNLECLKCSFCQLVKITSPIPLDFGFETLDLDLGLGFGTKDLDLGLTIVQMFRFALLRLSMNKKIYMTELDKRKLNLFSMLKSISLPYYWSREHRQVKELLCHSLGQRLNQRCDWEKLLIMILSKVSGSIQLFVFFYI